MEDKSERDYILYEGWLYKPSTILKRLQKHWVTLTSRQIIYYKSKSSNSVCIPLREVMRVEKAPFVLKKGFCSLKLSLPK